MEPVHFYHIGANGEWPVLEGILAEHFGLLDRTGFPGKHICGIVGPEESRVRVKDWLSDRVQVCVEADEGYEQVTLQRLHDLCKRVLNPVVPVLYTHTKGAFHNSTLNANWRREMDEMLIAPWPLRIQQLTDFDTIGLHWLTHEEYPDQIQQPGIFGGNFWWATAGYLAGLPELDWSERHGAEGWVGLNDPQALNLKPGWPVY